MKIMFPQKLSLLILILAIGSPALYAQDTPDLPIEEVIKRFSEKEKEFAAARANYIFRQDVRVQVLSANDRVLEEYHVTSDIGFDNRGRRTEKVVYAPQSTLERIQLTPQDLQDIREIQPFVLTSDDIHKYDLKYVGKEDVDEITAYAFDV